MLSVMLEEEGGGVQGGDEEVVGWPGGRWRLFWPFCGLNVIVWVGWKVPAMQSFMMRRFMGSPASRATCIPLLLSAVFHHSLIHLQLHAPRSAPAGQVAVPGCLPQL